MTLQVDPAAMVELEHPDTRIRMVMLMETFGDGQCQEAQRGFLDSFTLADIAGMARGDAPWPG